MWKREKKDMTRSTTAKFFCLLNDSAQQIISPTFAADYVCVKCVLVDLLNEARRLSLH